MKEYTKDVNKLKEKYPGYDVSISKVWRGYVDMDAVKTVYSIIIFTRDHKVCCLGDLKADELKKKINDLLEEE